MTAVEPAWLRDLLVCPACRGELEDAPDALICRSCALVYPVEDGAPFLVVECARPLDRSDPAPTR